MPQNSDEDSYMYDIYSGCIGKISARQASRTRIELKAGELYEAEGKLSLGPSSTAATLRVSLPSPLSFTSSCELRRFCHCHCLSQE